MYFQYFFPGRTKITRDELVQLGLGYAFELEANARPGSNLAPRTVVNGPGGQNGLVVSLSSEWCGYHAQQQVWKQEVGEDYWVGMWTEKAKRPNPETVGRENLIRGESLRLADGHAWTLPKARHFEELDGEIIPIRTLPVRLTRDEGGNWIPGEVEERYRELWRLATELMQSVAEGSDVWFSELDNLVVECFRANYRVSAIELDLLGIYNDHVRMRVPRILLDEDNFDVLWKKKQTTPGTGSSSDGPTESPPDAVTETTGPPVAT